MKKTKVGTITLVYMQERGLEAIQWGDQAVLDELSILTNRRCAKQKDNWKDIFYALDRDDRFKRTMVPKNISIPSQKRLLPMMVRRFQICNNKKNDIEDMDDDH